MNEPNEMVTGEKEILVNNVDELTVPKIGFSDCAWCNCKGKGHIAKFCRGQGGTETYVNDVNGINDKLFCRTILKIAVVGHENKKKSFYNGFVCLI